MSRFFMGKLINNLRIFGMFLEICNNHTVVGWYGNCKQARIMPSGTD
jgi:hypothetical protein